MAKKSTGKKREFNSNEFRSNYSSDQKKASFLTKLAKALNISMPASAQETIPIKNMYTDGMFELPNHEYSKSWHVLDVNFDMESDQKKVNIYNAYRNIFNRFSDGIRVQISLVNRYRDEDEYDKSILIPLKEDEHDKYREELNKMLLEKKQLGENEIEKGIYITLTITANTADEARRIFRPLEKSIADDIQAINKSQPKPMTINERCAVLYDVFNCGKEGEFLAEYIDRENGENFNNFDMGSLSKMGLSPKDMISPTVFKFDKKAFKMGNKFGQVLYIKRDFPSALTSDLFVKLNSMKSTMATSMHCTALSKDVTQKSIRNTEVNLNASLVKVQKKASQSGYDPQIASTSLQEQRDALMEIRRAVSTGTEKLIDTTIVILHTADTMEELDRQVQIIDLVCKEHDLSCATLDFQQEEGLMSALPMGYNDVHVKRTLTTQVVSCLLPFQAQEIYNRHGLYYGTNATTQRLLIYNRKQQKSSNAMVLGTTGSGKSFKTKEEIVQVFLNTDDDIIIVDPEGEYGELVKRLGGTAVEFSAGHGVHINPFDMDEDYGVDETGFEENPLVLKNSVIVSLFEVVMGGQLNRGYTSIIDRCMTETYQKWLQTKDPDDIPTLLDLYETLKRQEEGEAKTLARAVEQFTKGNLDLLSGKTNVDVNNRFISYNTLRLSNPALKDMALIACLNDIWNRILANKRKGKYTWVYIDEFHLYLRSKEVMQFLLSIWKRARKWNGIPTGITQNASDLLSTQESSTILANCDTVIMLNQAATDRDLLEAQYGLSEAEKDCLNSAKIGTGLMKVGDAISGQAIIPFTDAFPRNTELYALMNTSASQRP